MNLSDSQLRYHGYLQSDYWKQVSDAVKAKAGYRCQVCNSPHDLQAHHRSYANRGKELEHIDDLTCLCRRCHETFHGKDEKPQGMHKAQILRTPPAPVEREMVLVTAQNCKRIRHTKAPWHWLKDNGIDPRRKGWMKRAIGHHIPREFMR